VEALRILREEKGNGMKEETFPHLFRMALYIKTFFLLTG